MQKAAEKAAQVIQERATGYKKKRPADLSIFTVVQQLVSRGLAGSVGAKIGKYPEWQRNIKFRQRYCLFPNILAFPTGRKAHRCRIYIGIGCQQGFQLVLEVVIR